MNKYVLLALLIFTAYFTNAQHSRIYGVINEDDWNLKEWEDDPEAAAVVLFKIGHISFPDDIVEKSNYTSYGYDIEFSVKQRIKILKQSAVDDAEFYVGLYGSKGTEERLLYMEANIYNNDNGSITVTEVKKNDLVTEKVNDSYQIKKLAYPQVKVGSIIEFAYTIQSPFMFKPPTWTFQSNIPTAYSRIRFDAIPFYEYQFMSQGIEQFDEYNAYEGENERENKYYKVKFREMVNVFGVENIPAFTEESYITTREDYIKKLEFQLSRYQKTLNTKEDVMSTWPELCKELLTKEDFGGFLGASQRKAKKVLAQIPNLPEDKFEKSKAIIDYVKTNYNWNERYGRYTVNSVSEFMKTKKGNSAEINLFTVALLRESGIICRPLLLSTRNNGKVKANYPFITFFNNVIVYIDDQFKYLADASEKQTQFNMIPSNCLNNRGLMVHSKDPEWVSLNHNPKSESNITINLKIEPDSFGCEATITSQSIDYAAYRRRKIYKDDQDELKDYFENNGLEAENIKSINYDKLEAPYILAAQGNVKIESVEEDFIVKPFLSFPFEENPFKLKKRDYPIDFVTQYSVNLSTTIQIPEGYKLYETPEGLSISNALADIELTYNESGSKVEVKGKYSFKKAEYRAEDYLTIKSYFQSIVDKFNEDLVFVKG